jgi:hypothetical protein
MLKAVPFAAQREKKRSTSRSTPRSEASPNLRTIAPLGPEGSPPTDISGPGNPLTIAPRRDAPPESPLTQIPGVLEDVVDVEDAEEGV